MLPGEADPAVGLDRPLAGGDRGLGALCLRRRRGDAGLRVVAEADDGEAAIKAWRAHPADVMLLDLSMPGIDGIEATRRIHEGNRGTAVIVLSGHDDDVSLARSIQAGARGFLPKSEAVIGLADAIRRSGLPHVPTSVLSRDVCGVRDGILIVNLPGSTGGVKDGLGVLADVLDHALDQLMGQDHTA